MQKRTIQFFASMVIIARIVVAQEDNEIPVTARDYFQRAARLEGEKRIDEALAAYRAAGELDPKLFDAFFSQSSLLEKRNDRRGAIDSLTACLLARPHSYSALINRALNYESLSEYDLAIADYGLALSDDADLSFVGTPLNECRAQSYHYRGRVYQSFKREYAKAIDDYSKALRLHPEIEMVRYRRGQAYQAIKEFGKAQSDFEEAIKRTPDYPNLLNSWAWQLATCPDPKFRDGLKAIRFATKTNSLDTLAAAHAETGNFEEAVALQEKAIQQLRSEDSRKRQSAEQYVKLRNGMQTRLTEYQAGRPYRDR